MSSLMETILDDTRPDDLARNDLAELLADAATLTAALPVRSVLDFVGHWYVEHFRSRAEVGGTQTAARQLRKQGVPLDVALAILAPRRAVSEAAPTIPTVERADHPGSVLIH